jgi:hypothetical protein
MMTATPPYTNIKSPRLLSQIKLVSRPYKMACDYRGDGLGVKGKSTLFMQESKFVEAWHKTTEQIFAVTSKKVPDVRWRGHMALWAASQALHKEGDFVECGVFTGILSGLICHYFDFAKNPRRFWLFDTWGGIPTEGLSDTDMKIAEGFNKDYHAQDIFAGVQKNFSMFPECRLIRGFLPQSLSAATIDKIAYLSIDLNNAGYEQGCIEALWPKVVSGGVILLDDYNFSDCWPQQEMWNGFAAEKGIMIAALPTGQGLIIKP